MLLPCVGYSSFCVLLASDSSVGLGHAFDVISGSQTSVTVVLCCLAAVLAGSVVLAVLVLMPMHLDADLSAVPVLWPTLFLSCSPVAQQAGQYGMQPGMTAMANGPPSGGMMRPPGPPGPLGGPPGPPGMPGVPGYGPQQLQSSMQQMNLGGPPGPPVSTSSAFNCRG